MVNNKINNKLLIMLFLLIIAVSFLMFPQEVYADIGPRQGVNFIIEDLPKSDYLACILVGNFKGMFFYESIDVDEHLKYLQAIESGEELSDLTQNEIYRQRRAQESYDKYCVERDWDYITFIKEIDRLTKDSHYGYSLYSERSFEDTTTVNWYGYYDGLPQDIILIIYNVNSKEFIEFQPRNERGFYRYYRYSYNSEDFNKTIEEGRVVYSENEISMKGSLFAWSGVVAFLLRVIGTFGIELLLALAYKFDKRSLIIITITNIVTQILLNIVVTVISFYSGGLMGFIVLLIGELPVFLIEPIVYVLACNRKTKEKKGILGYAFLANILSLIIGLMLSDMEMVIFANIIVKGLV